MSQTRIKTVDVQLTQSDVNYILHALRELKSSLRSKMDADADESLTHAYGDDIMNLRSIHEKLAQRAVPVFGEKVLEFSYEEL